MFELFYINIQIQFIFIILNLIIDLKSSSENLL